MNAVPTTGLGLPACLYTMEASGLLAAMALSRNGDKPLTTLLTSRYGPFLLAGLLGVLGFAVYLVSATAPPALVTGDNFGGRWR